MIFHVVSLQRHSWELIERSILFDVKIFMESGNIERKKTLRLRTRHSRGLVSIRPSCTPLSLQRPASLSKPSTCLSPHTCRDLPIQSETVRSRELPILFGRPSEEASFFVSFCVEGPVGFASFVEAFSLFRFTAGVRITPSVISYSSRSSVSRVRKMRKRGRRGARSKQQIQRSSS